MDSLIALKGKDFVIIAADTTNAYSVLRMKVPPTIFRTTMIKFGIQTDRSCLPLEVSTQMYLSSETIYKRTSPFYNTRMDTSYLSTIRPSSSDQSSQKLSEKDLTQLIVFWLGSKETNQGSIGLITLAQSQRLVKQPMDTRNTWFQVSQIRFK